MQLKHLRTFAAVADTLNLTRAGERLHLSQSSVTEQIQALELDLGVALFDRSRRRLALTPAARRLLDYAANILALSDEVRAVMAKEAEKVAGRVLIGAVDSLCARRLPEIVLSYRRAFPDVEVVLRSGKTVDLHNGLKAGALDVYFTFGHRSDEPSVHSEELGQEPIALIAPPGHRLAGWRSIRAGDLSGESFMITVAGCPMRNAFERVFAAIPADRPRILGEFTSVAAICSLVEAGAGCALVPLSAVSEALAAGRVVKLAWTGASHAPVAMRWRRKRELLPALRHFLDTARAERPVAA